MHRQWFGLVALGMLAASGCGLARSYLHPGSARAAGPSAAPASTPAAATAPGTELAVLPDDGVTSDLHRAYQGQIVFSTAEIPRDGADESALGAEFNADELIYARAFLPHSIENEPVIGERGQLQRSESLGYLVKLFVDGGEVTEPLESLAQPAKRRTATTLQVWPHPAATDQPTPRPWVQAINALTPGDHEIRLELWAHDRWFRSRAPLARGQITLHKAAGMTVGVGRSFADLDRGMTNASLATEMLGVARAFASKEGWKESMAEVAIRDKQWTDVLHPQLQYPIARRLQTWVRADWPDGHCTAQEMLFEQKVKRSRPDGPLYVGSSGVQVLLDCSATAGAPGRWSGRTRARPARTGAPVVATRTIGAKSPAAPVTAATPPTPALSVAAPPAVTSPAEPVPSAPAREVEQADTPVVHARASTTGSPGRFALAVGAAANTLVLDGVASYASVAARISRVELGVGATWPLNTLGFVRVALLTGRLELSTMVTASMLAESQMTTTFAVAGGLSTAYLLHTGEHAAGIRLDALVSFNPDTSRVAVPVIGSTFVRF